MPQVHSHYDNLKVARDASADEIRAAYRSLTRRHHPDRNPGDREAERVMSVVNVAYGVLSDPTRRSEHDRWLADAEAAPRARPVRHGITLHAPDRSRQGKAGTRRPAPPELRQVAFEKRLRRVLAHLRRHRSGYLFSAAALLSLGAAGIASMLEPGLLLGPLATAQPAPQVVPGYDRSALAPNGKAWPAQSGYVDGYPRLNRGGASEVMVDNSANDADMFAKLYALDGPTALPVRIFFVAAHGRFAVEGLTPGTYDLRYRNLGSGVLARSPIILLEEVATSQGTQHGRARIDLYAAPNGNMRSYALPEADF